MYSLSTPTEIENDSLDYENSSINSLLKIKENYDTYKFEQAFIIIFNNKENINNINRNIDEDNKYENYIKEYYNNGNIISSKNINVNKDNILLGKKRDFKKFKVNKINPKREIAFITFNAKFNKYLTEKVNRKIDEIGKKSIFSFTNENPLLSTKYTQCGIQKTLKKYLKFPLKEFIKIENFKKICEIGIDNDSLFNTLISDLIVEYYEFIYSNQNEFNKFFFDKKFAIRNDKFSKEGLINLKYPQNNKKVYGFLDYFKNDLNFQKSEGKDKRIKFSIL